MIKQIHMCFSARLIVSVLCSLIMLSCESSLSTREQDASQGIQSGFVSVDGQEFIRGGRPYSYVGTNFWYGAYLGASDKGRERLRQELDLLASLGVTNLRVLASSEKTDMQMAVSPAIHLEPGVFNEELLVGLDVLLDEMSKRNMLAVLYMNNFWQWSGGMSQYMSWLTGEPAWDPDVKGDWNGFMQNSAAFYRSAEAQAWYQSAIRHLITRTNTVNGIPYTQDSTIMSWQLANEPRPGSDESGRPFYPHYKNWVQETARFIKSLDSNHLVSTGSEGAMGTLRDIALYEDAHSIPEVDYLTFHMWPKNWSWFDVLDVEGTYDSSIANSKAYILQHLDVAKRLNKPTVLEEFGLERDNGDYAITSSTAVRDQFYQDIFGFIEMQAKIGQPIRGSNFWTWGGAGRAQHSDLIWRSGDPFTGDPPQEAQGLNSVFDSDHSTLDILSNHAQEMNAIGR